MPVTMEIVKSFIKVGRPMTTIVASTLVTKDTRVITAKTTHLFGATPFNFKTSLSSGLVTLTNVQEIYHHVK
jgi:hypothetical protein